MTEALEISSKELEITCQYFILYALNSFLVTAEAIWNEIQDLKQMKRKWVPAVKGKKKYSSVGSSESLSLATECWKFNSYFHFKNFIIMKLSSILNLVPL